MIDAALAGDRRALARLLSRVEAGGDDADAILQQVYPQSGGAHVVGVTGAPGTGKSTLVGQLAQEVRRRQESVAIVAVDPSSPFTGGALLGDRVRMAALAGDRGIFVRSMASRGAAGGLAEQTAAAGAVLAAAGYDLVVVETVGAGQGELDVAAEAQTTLVVTAPGLGDGVQALKAGILEIADVLVVNKADREGADRLAADLRFALSRRPQPPARSPQPPNASSGHKHPGYQGHDFGLQTSDFGPDWSVPIVRTVATRGDGVAELVDAVEAHRAWLRASGRGAARARALAERHILNWLAAKARRRAERAARASGLLDRLVEEVAARRLAPPAAAEELLRSAEAPPPATP